MDVIVREMWAPDLGRGVFKSLEALAEVGLTVEEGKKVFQNQLKHGIRVCVALSGEKVVGVASMFIMPHFIHKGGHSAHIEDVAVDKDHQRQGIGSKLVEWCEEQARKHRCYKVVLDCSEKNVPFYQKVGYKIQGTQMRKDLA